jgi:hypothetical protein
MGWFTSIIGFAAGNWQRLVIYGLLILGLLSAAAGWGYMHGVQRLYDYQVKQANQAVKIIIKQGAATERILIKYIKVKGKTEYVTQTITERVTEYAQTNPGNCLDTAWGRLHDSAAANTISNSSARMDDSSGTPAAATALETVTKNYAACHRTADRLDAVQEWLTKQSKIKSGS